jgi:hypothetical protein
MVVADIRGLSSNLMKKLKEDLTYCTNPFTLTQVNQIRLDK